jgi:hypothetical protein
MKTLVLTTFAMVLISPILAMAQEAVESQSYVSIDVPTEMLADVSQIKGVSRLSLVDTQAKTFDLPELPTFSDDLISENSDTIYQQNSRAFAIQVDSNNAVRRHTGLQ